MKQRTDDRREESINEDPEEKTITDSNSPVYRFGRRKNTFLNYFKMAQNTKKNPRKKFFCNESLRNLKNVLQGNLRTDRAKEYTNLELFRGSGGTNFENFSAWLHPTFAGSMGVPVCPKKLWICH